MIAKAITLAGLLGATAWLARNPDWEPAITAIGLLAALVGLEVQSIRKGTTSIAQSADTALFRKLLSALPSTGRTARFLSEHDIGVSFQSSELDEMDQFLDQWKTVEHEFQSKKLEAKRKALFVALGKFRVTLTKAVGPTNVPGFLSIGLDDFEERPHMLDTHRKLNEMGSEAYRLHQELIRAGRKQLHVDG